jgi:uncharacterized protein YndB with AHSA1/START domain
MDTIATQIDIQAPVRKVIDAITTTTGHQGWWTTDCEVGARPGEKARFRFHGEGHDAEMGFRIDRQDDSGIEWTCVDHHNSPEWLETRLRLRVVPAPSGARVELEHSGWRGKTAMFEQCTRGWQHFMGSLKAYLESGVGTPFRK